MPLPEDLAKAKDADKQPSQRRLEETRYLRDHQREQREAAAETPRTPLRERLQQTRQRWQQGITDYFTSIPVPEGVSERLAENAATFRAEIRKAQDQAYREAFDESRTSGPINWLVSHRRASSASSDAVDLTFRAIVAREHAGLLAEQEAARAQAALHPALPAASYDDAIPLPAQGRTDRLIKRIVQAKDVHGTVLQAELDVAMVNHGGAPLPATARLAAHTTAVVAAIVPQGLADAIEAAEGRHERALQAAFTDAALRNAGTDSLSLADTARAEAAAAMAVATPIVTTVLDTTGERFVGAAARVGAIVRNIVANTGEAAHAYRTTRDAGFAVLAEDPAATARLAHADLTTPPPEIVTVYTDAAAAALRPLVTRTGDAIRTTAGRVADVADYVTFGLPANVRDVTMALLPERFIDAATEQRDRLAGAATRLGEQVADGMDAVRVVHGIARETERDIAALRNNGGDGGASLAGNIGAEVKAFMAAAGTGVRQAQRLLPGRGEGEQQPAPVQQQLEQASTPQGQTVAGPDAPPERSHATGPAHRVTTSTRSGGH